jgi:hypothetical protein
MVIIHSKEKIVNKSISEYKICTLEILISSIAMLMKVLSLTAIMRMKVLCLTATTNKAYLEINQFNASIVRP